MRSGMHAAAAAPSQSSGAATPRSEESLRVAVLLSIAGGSLDAFTWIAHHGVMANAQTANETFVAGWIEKHDRAARRQSVVLVTVCATFALGAALGAVLTRSLESRALFVPIALLVVALVQCGRAPARVRTRLRAAERAHG